MATATKKRNLNIDEFEQIVLHKAPVPVTAAMLGKVNSSYAFLNSFLPGKVIYGINTGFGPMAQYKVEKADAVQLQLNLIRSHSSGMGKLLTQTQVRALMLARLNTLALGYSGIHEDTLILLAALINNEAYPCIYAHGGVGASGDLVQLAHLALGMIGEGNYWYKGEITPAAEVFAALQLQPLSIYIREGLALLNGTSAMAGIAGINVIMARRLLVFSTLISTVINEIMEAYDDHISAPLNSTKRHTGQNTIAAWMRAFSTGGLLLRKRSEHLYYEKVLPVVFEEHVQECYSLRCVPQIAGAVLDTIINAQIVVENELNSVNDNPVIDTEQQDIFHGGNFHGDYISLEMDKLKLVVTKLSMLAERQLNFLLNPALNKKLPAFVNAGRPGLNFGLQGMQYPATSTVAENQSLSASLYIHSIPNNNDNQDIVSMGCNAALACSTVIENTFEVLAIEAAAVAQAIQLLKVEDRLSGAGKWLLQNVREVFPFFIEDFAPYERLKDIKTWLMDTDIERHFKIKLNGNS